MLVKFGKLEKPRRIVVEEGSATPTFARFIAEPFERVFGHAIGNALRRILLSSLEAPGILSVRIEGIPHEFMAIEGISEDMTNIVLNFKAAKLRCLPSEETSTTRDARILTSLVEVSQDDLDKNGGFVVITLKDVVPTGVFEVVNPDLKLFTVTKPMKRQVDVRVGYGKGYVSSERHIIPNRMVDEVVIDTAFSPVTLVNYFVENTRVGQDTDFDRLVLEVTTDGRLTPAEALSFATQVAIKNFDVFNQTKVHDLTFEAVTKDSQADNDELLDKLLLRVDEIELSVRSTNCLNLAGIETIAELVSIPEKRMLEFRNFGKKSLNEIKAKLADMSLGLGMNLEGLGIEPEGTNVKERVKELLELRKQKKDKKKK
ncbi:MAG: DNA-directed RNA polymerase subunit alpha [Verrucomicrobia bacterium]|nr:DNA-directed RNA polymerase subunit alpha [Verrucomicrobiota bacterium]